PAGAFVSRFNTGGLPPDGLAVDPGDGDIYVADADDTLVEKFTAAGAFVAQIGGPGSGNGTFGVPTGAAVDPSTRNLYISDPGLRLVQTFAADGTFLTQFGGLGSGHGTFGSPTQMAVDPLT